MTEPTSFPDALRVDPAAADPGTERTAQRHNACLDAYAYEIRTGHRGPITRQERSWLAPAAGLAALVEAMRDDIRSDYLLSEIVHGIAQQLSTLLNYDLGRLDAHRGELSAWLCRLQLSCHIDPDTGEAISEADAARYFEPVTITKEP